MLNTTTGSPDRSSASVKADKLHATAIDAACSLDRDHFERFPGSHYVRPMLEHELCIDRCRPAAGRLVLVTWIGPDVRARMEWAA